MPETRYSSPVHEAPIPAERQVVQSGARNAIAQSMSAGPFDPTTLDLITRLSADLRRRSGELDAVLNTLPIGIGIAEDRQCRRIRVNRAFAEQLGISPSQNASLTAPEDERPPFKVLKNGIEVPPDQLPMQYAAAHGVEVLNVELDVVHENGRRVSLYEWAVPLFDEKGAVRGAIGVFMDITERRRVEQEQRFLADAGRVLSSTLDYETTLSSLARLAVPDIADYCAIDVVQDDGAFARVNMVVADPAKQPIADGLKRYAPVLGSDSPGAQVIRTGEALLATDCPPDYVARAAQNPEHFQLLTDLGVRSFMILPLRARGRTLGLLTIGSTSPRFRYDERDLRFASEVASRAGLALDNALLYRDAQDANRLKEDFLATLSHELRTPLNALLGWTHILKNGRLDEATVKRGLESIERNAGAQAVLINDLLDVSRAVSGKLRIEPQPIDLQAVVLAAVDAVKPAVRAREIDVVISIGTLASPVFGDPDRLQQVVWNLLSNAVKFTPAGGQVEIAVKQTGGAAQIAVTDNGIGIDQAFLPYVFDRFRQADSGTTRTHGGLGLGLAIVRYLVDLHGGTVTVESAGPGHGSTFVVTLPLKPAPKAVESTPGASSTVRSDRLRGVHVLAVDDDADSRELILVALQGAGAEVMAVGSAAAALEALDSFAPQVIVADVAMPGTDGYELMRRIAETSTRPRPPAIALSAYVPDEDVRTRDAGFAFHVAKPADYDDLISKIAHLASSAGPPEKSVI
jgi:signal transduction histidine kinase/PAS domain-containing protein/ActR/RegA family two-component response regulator